MATLKTSPEANYDGHGTDGQKKRLIGARATALPKKQVLPPNISGKFSLIDTELVQTMAVGFLLDKKLYMKI